MRIIIYCRKSMESEDRQILSLDSQESEIGKLLVALPAVEIVATYRESQSAKRPGRVGFDEMLSRIEKGEADAIVSWHPDRLARNALDGARIIDLLDRGRLRHLRFCTFSYENTPQGKLMLFTLFGFSKYYVDSLSENVKRGNRTKAERGWRPSRPPIGYLHDNATKTIVPDPERFELVKRMLQLMLSGIHTPRSIHRLAKYEWGLRSIKRKHQGGGTLHLSSINTILRNPFYAGLFPYEGRTMVGKHPPMISISEYERLQALLRRPGIQRPQSRVFTFTGMLRCGGCGLSITAEEKRNRYGYLYTYYHCTRSNHEMPCREPYLRVEQLEEQILAFLDSLRIAASITEDLIAELGSAATSHSARLGAQRTSISTHVDALNRELATLTDMRVRSLVTDDEFMEKRSELTRARLAALERLRDLDQEEDWPDLLRTLISFSNSAVEYFRNGDDEQRRLVLAATSSNRLLKQRILSIEARKPFARWGATPTKSGMCAFTLDVRTLIESKDKDLAEILSYIKKVTDRAGGTSKGLTA
jgi:site-specific DNA recombinase